MCARRNQQQGEAVKIKRYVSDWGLEVIKKGSEATRPIIKLEEETDYPNEIEIHIPDTPETPETVRVWRCKNVSCLHGSCPDGYKESHNCQPFIATLERVPAKQQTLLEAIEEYMEITKGFYDRLSLLDSTGLHNAKAKVKAAINREQS